ncbi:MAG: matrixin family metalloprotease [Isosphaeraceae bacterium]
MAVAGTDYALSGLRWQTPSHISYSIAPDGVFWDHGVNTLNASFTARFGTTWKREIARALATWQSVANLNIALVNDGPYKLDAIGQSQGDPRFGDIRFGGYAFANTTTTLAHSYFPPPDGWTAAGDVAINTAMNYNVGSDYDFFSVMLHETGHALGLEHPTDPTEVMYANYGGVRTNLQEGDLAGILAIYGPRQPDGYRASGQGGSFAQAIDLGSRFNGSGTAVVAGLSLSSIGDTEYFSFVAPAGAAGGLRVSACANGFSLLSPRVSVHDASGRLLNTQADASSWSNNVTSTLASLTPGQRYFVSVAGATSDVFSVGAYALLVQFDGPSSSPGGATPDPDLADSPEGSGVSADRFEPNDRANRAVRIGLTNQVVVGNLTLDSASDVDTFSFRNGRAGIVVASAAGASLRIVDGSGRVLAEGNNQVGAAVSRPNLQLYVQVRSATGDPLASYALGITCSAAPSRSRLRSLSTDRASDTLEILPTSIPPAVPVVRWNFRPRAAAWRG